MKPVDVTQHKGEFFKVLSETGLSQVAAMTIAPGKDSGPEEIHKGDQIVYVIQGTGEVEIEHEKHAIKAGEVVIIQAGSQHHFYNNSNADLFCVNIYCPPEY